jgi:hypothetical protein
VAVERRWLRAALSIGDASTATGEAWTGVELARELGAVIVYRTPYELIAHREMIARHVRRRARPPRSLKDAMSKRLPWRPVDRNFAIELADMVEPAQDSEPPSDNLMASETTTHETPTNEAPTTETPP